MLAGARFQLWAERTSLWWPSGHSVSAAPGLTVTFEPRAGGRIYERTPEGIEHDWGEVLEWAPPDRLRYLWHLRFDRGDATEVEVGFAAAAEGTRVTNHPQRMGAPRRRGGEAPRSKPARLGRGDGALPARVRGRAQPRLTQTVLFSR